MRLILLSAVLRHNIGETVSFRPHRVAQLGGVSLSTSDIQGILERLGFKVDRHDYRDVDCAGADMASRC